MATVKKSPTMSAEERQYRARSDAETLARAKEIEADRTRHGAAKAHASNEAKRYTAVCKGPAKRR